MNLAGERGSGEEKSKRESLWAFRAGPNDQAPFLDSKPSEGRRRLGFWALACTKELLHAHSKLIGPLLHIAIAWFLCIARPLSSPKGRGGVNTTLMSLLKTSSFTTKRTLTVHGGAETSHLLSTLWWHKRGISPWKYSLSMHCASLRVRCLLTFYSFAHMIRLLCHLHPVCARINVRSFLTCAFTPERVGTLLRGHLDNPRWGFGQNI